MNKIKALIVALLAFVGLATQAAEQEPISYLDWDAENKVMTNAVCTAYTVVTAETATLGSGWYVVTNEVERDTISVNGAAHLILVDGACLTVNAEDREPAVSVQHGNSLMIYGQTEGTGELRATADNSGAGIGGQFDDCGSVTINGGEDAKKTLADNVSGAFVCFAKTGNPGANWATYDTTERQLLQADYLKYREEKLRTGDMPVYAHDLRTVKPYLHEIWYDNYEDSDLTGYDAPFLDLESQYHGGCSSVRVGNYHGRNLDIGISDTATIVVHMKAGEGRFASVGTSQWGDVSETALQAGSVSDHRFDVLPNWMLDGINENGVAININVIPMDVRQEGDDPDSDEDGNAGTLTLELFSADTVVYGTIRTAEATDYVEGAIAIKDGKYVYVGDEAGVAPFIKDGVTKVVDHRGQGMVMPGCTDGHSHYAMAFALPQIKGGVMFSTDDDKAAVLEKLEAAAQAAKDAGKSCLYGFGWYFYKLRVEEDNNPTLEELDAATHGVSTVIFDSTGHNAYCNSECLKRCKIISEDGGTVLITKIDGGVLELDENGYPTGFVDERVTGYLMRMGGVNYDEIVDDGVAEGAIRKTQGLLLSTGYTMALDGWSNQLHPSKFYEAANRMDTDGELKFILPMTYEVEPWQTNMTEQIDYLASLNATYGTSHVLPKYLKLFMDGVVETKTGATIKPYKDGTYYKSFWPTNRLAEITRECNAKGLTVHTHTMGDAAIRETVDAYIQGGDGTHRNCLVHLRNVSTNEVNDFQRIAENNIACAAGLTWHATDTDFDEVLRNSLCEEYVKHAYPIKSLLDAGIKASGHSDYPANIPSPQDPFGMMQVAVTGMVPDPGELDYPFDTDELITVEQAFQALTINGAWQLGLENERGSIKVGKWADFVLADQDVFECETTDIHKTKVVSTWFEGEMVYPMVPGSKMAPWKIGDCVEAYTNGTELVIGGKDTISDLSAIPTDVKGGITAINVASNGVAGVASDAFQGVGDGEIALTLPDGWQGELPDEEGNWYGATGVTLTAYPLAVKNIKFQQRYPWNGLVDISCDLTGSGTVTLGASVLTNGVEFIANPTLVGETAVDLGDGVVTNGVKFIWNAEADLPAGFKAQNVKVEVKIAGSVVSAVSAEGFLNLTVGDRVAKDTETIAVDPAWGNASEAQVQIDGEASARMYSSASNDTWDTTALTPGRYTLALLAGDVNESAAFWKLGAGWVVFDGSNVTADVTFEAGKTYLFFGTNTADGVTLKVEDGAKFFYGEGVPSGFKGGTVTMSKRYKQEVDGDLYQIVEVIKGCEDNPWDVGEGVAAYTNGNELVIGGNGTIADISGIPAEVMDGVESLTIAEPTVTGSEAQAFADVGTDGGSVSLSLPDGWQGELPDEDGNWYGATGVTLAAVPLAVKNVTFQQRYPWNGLVDIGFGLTGPVGETNVVITVEDGETAAANFTAAVTIPADGVLATNLVWDAAGLAADFKSDAVTVEVAFAGGSADGDVVQLWENGPYWETSNVGESENLDYPEYGELYKFDDATNAVAALDNDWRLPTKADLDALKNICSRTWDSTRKGWTFTGTGDYASNSIFMPAAGYRPDDVRQDAGTFGYYWSSTPTDSGKTYNFHFGNANPFVNEGNRDYGMSVRAVRDVLPPVPSAIAAKSEAGALDLRTAVALDEYAVTVAGVGYSDTAWGAATKADVTLGWTNLTTGATGVFSNLAGVVGEAAEDADLPQKDGEYVLTHSTGDLTSFVKFTVSGYPLGSEGNPWEIGAGDDPASMTAWKDGDTVFFTPARGTVTKAGLETITNAMGGASFTAKLIAADGSETNDLVMVLGASGTAYDTIAEALAANEASYTLFDVKGANVEFNAMGGVHANGSEIVTNFCVVTYTLPEAERKDYTFAGWYDSWTNGAAVVTNGQDLLSFEPHSLYAQWNSTAPVESEEGELHLEDIVDDVPVTTIADKAYASNTELKTVTTPLYLKKIGNRAFMGCSAMKSLTLTATRDYETLEPTPLTIDTMAFAGCTSIEELVIGGKVKLGAGAFQNVATLKKIIFRGDKALEYNSDEYAFYLAGTKNGTGELKLYMSNEFATNNPNLVADFAKWNKGVKVIEKVDVTPVDGIGTISIDFSKLEANGRRAAVMVKTSFAGKPDVADVDIEYASDLFSTWTKLTEGTVKTAYPDGTIMIEIVVPQGESGYFRAVLNTQQD